jgi:phasin family protein
VFEAPAAVPEIVEDGTLQAQHAADAVEVTATHAADAVEATVSEAVDAAAATATQTDETAEATVSEAMETAEAAATHAAEIVETTVSEAVDTATVAVADVVDAETKIATAVAIAAQETAELVDDSSSSAPTGLSVLGRKALEHAQFNASAYVDHVTGLMSAKSIPEVIELNTAFAKKVAETLAAQTKEFSELAQRTATEAVESIKTRFEKSFKRAA